MPVRLLLLTARPDLPANHELARAAAAAGADLVTVDSTRAVAGCGPPSITSEGRELLEPRPDGVLARVGNWRPESSLALLEVAVGAGAATPNPPSALRSARDHWRTVRRLGEAGLPIPESLAGADPEVLATAAWARLGRAVVVKQRRSRMGVGTIRCSSLDHLQAVLDSLWRVGDEIMVQRFVPTDGTSLRLVVAGQQVVAAARFRAPAGEWRSNAARGGTVEPWAPGGAHLLLAREAARVLGLGQCAVDLLPAAEGPVICDVNPTPGFRALSAAVDVDVAAALVGHLIGLARS